MSIRKDAMELRLDSNMMTTRRVPGGEQERVVHDFRSMRDIVRVAIRESNEALGWIYVKDLNQRQLGQSIWLYEQGGARSGMIDTAFLQGRCWLGDIPVDGARNSKRMVLLVLRLERMLRYHVRNLRWVGFTTPSNTRAVEEDVMFLDTMF